MPLVTAAPDGGFVSSVQAHAIAVPAQEKARGRQPAPQSACAECLRRRAATRAAFVDKKGS